jgi:hypothetical protein
MKYHCPYCGSFSILTERSIYQELFEIPIRTAEHTFLSLSIRAMACPNADCKKMNLRASYAKHDENYRVGGPHFEVLDRWQLLPNSGAKPLPDYIPEAIVQDYKEAHAVLNASPKASATLARRCLQGIVRDFWEIPKTKRGNLGAELAFIKEKVDPDTWTSVKTIRSVGDIGAHMEKDVNTIIDVEKDEAELLLSLIETLIEDWYVMRFKRAERTQKAKDLVASKRKAQSAAKVTKRPDKNDESDS